MLKARRSELLLILSAMMFASNGIASKLLLPDYISPWRLAQIRAISACAILAMYLWRTAPQTFRIKRSEILPLVSYGIIGIAMSLLFRLQLAWPEQPFGIFEVLLGTL